MTLLQNESQNNNHKQSGDRFYEPILETENKETLSPEELAEIWAGRAYDLAEEPPAPASGQTVDLLVFWVAGERYGIEVANVREIYPLEQLTPVPRTPDFVAGVFSARGRILSIIDLRAFLGLQVLSTHLQGAEEGVAPSKVIVVTNTDSTLQALPSAELMEVGILADDVADVITIFKEDIEPSLTTTHSGTGQTGSHAEHLQGVTADMLVVLNLHTLLSDKRLFVHEEII